jgi:hypothetical protein
VIAVVGNPIGRRVGGGIVAGGLPVAVARAAAGAGAGVQLIGKVGQGPDGDAIVLSIAADRIGHVALLRDTSPVAIEIDADDVDPDRPIDEEAGLDDRDHDVDATGEAPVGPDVAVLDPADLDLALRYLPDYRVVVIAQPLGADALGAALDAARWSGAQIVLVTSADPASAPIPDDATILEASTEDAEGAFASVVGRYAAALDAGTTPADAFATASGAIGWTAVAD